MWWRKPREPAEDDSSELMDILHSYGRYLMSIDAKLEEIAVLLGGDDDAGSDADR